MCMFTEKRIPVYLICFMRKNVVYYAALTSGGEFGNTPDREQAHDFLLKHAAEKIRDRMEAKDGQARTIITDHVPVLEHLTTDDQIEGVLKRLANKLFRGRA